ncbi:hypothetical protein K0M31_010752, partial [Melipona bicolor]
DRYTSWNSSKREAALQFRWEKEKKGLAGTSSAFLGRLDDRSKIIIPKCSVEQREQARLKCNTVVGTKQKTENRKQVVVGRIVN